VDQQPGNRGPREEPLSPASNSVEKAENSARACAGGLVIAGGLLGLGLGPVIDEGHSL